MILKLAVLTFPPGKTVIETAAVEIVKGRINIAIK